MRAEPLTRHVTSVFRTATPEQIRTGLAWYRDARDVAAGLASKHNVGLEVATGVIAALSPLQSWGSNVRMADALLDAGGLHFGYLKVGLTKASLILSGEDTEAVLRGDKIVNFYRCIMAGGETDAVCVDRHAVDIAVNHRHPDTTRPTVRGKRYAAFADRYRRATRILNKQYDLELFPAQVQAITWVTWRNRHWAPGAFDIKEEA